MYEIEGLSGEQIAEVTGSNIRTVWVRLSRARHKFIERMRAWETKETS
jgi:DNA-directed RNA polymerase specialized sigma24 family protein